MLKENLIKQIEAATTGTCHKNGLNDKQIIIHFWNGVTMTSHTEYIEATQEAVNQYLESL